MNNDLCIWALDVRDGITIQEGKLQTGKKEDFKQEMTVIINTLP